ncbi:MAG: class I SAM-dependent methyltransferase [Bacteriovoracaceae bacterium]|jgi:16S rRNA (guanine527-N7)-methyltransferase|nr:class I SAM-dependent methyltransferase [Bacteriovoracaceae bacterium]
MIDSDFTKKYYDLLTNEFKGINLTRITDFEEFKLKQILDSIKPYEVSTVFKDKLDECKTMVDIGFGGGFPILPMANYLKDYKFYGIETRNKKVNVVGQMASMLDLNNVTLNHNRIENVLIDKNVVCTFKAVGKVNDFLNKINTTKKITVFFYKGPNFYDIEKEQIEMTKEDWNIIEEIEIDIPGTEKRYLIGFENKNVPYGTNGMNQLVKLSTFH